MTTKKLYYGWVIVGVAFLTMAVSYSFRYSFSVFSDALESEFSWSRSAIYGGFSVVTLTYGFSSPVIGRIFDRFGARPVYASGAICIGLSLIGLVFATRLYHFYTLLIFGALGMAALGFVSNGALVSRWFLRRRGAAMGLATCGTGFGMFVIVGLTIPWIIENYGYRPGYLFLAVLAFFVILPMSTILLRDRPGDKGLEDHEELLVHNEEDEGKKTGDTGKPRFSRMRMVDPVWAKTEWTVSSAIKTRRFWAIFLTTLLFPFGAYSVMMHQVQYALDLGFDMLVASSAFGVLGMWGMVGKFGWGFISDRIGREIAFGLGVGCCVVGLIILMGLKSGSSIWALYLYSAIFGLGYGVAQPLGTAVSADLFQGKNFGAIFGCIGLAAGIGGAIGPLFAAAVFDATNNYDLAFTVTMVSFIGAALSIWMAEPRKVWSVTPKLPLKKQSFAG